MPVPISIQFGSQQNLASPDASPQSDAPLMPNADGSFGIEDVVIDQTNYDKRPGYNETFLGKGKLQVPLPVLSKTQRAKAVKRIGGGTDNVLHYYNYSVVMNGERKLALLSAVNIDGSAVAARAEG